MKIFYHYFKYRNQCVRMGSDLKTFPHIVEKFFRISEYIFKRCLEYLRAQWGSSWSLSSQSHGYIFVAS